MTGRLPRLGLAGGLFAVLVFAQGPGGGGPPDPQAMLQMRVNFLQQRVGLTDEQKAKATSILADSFSAGQSVRASMQNARQAFGAAVRKNDTAGIEQQAAAIGNLTGQLTAIDGKAEAALYLILTPEQRAKYDQLGRAGGAPGGAEGRRPGGGPPRQ